MFYVNELYFGKTECHLWLGCVISGCLWFVFNLVIVHCNNKQKSCI